MSSTTPIRTRPPTDDPEEIKPYIRMRYVPAFVARGIYLAYVDEVEVRPPAFSHKPPYPKYQNLPPATGIAVPRSPRVRVYPFFGLQLVLVYLFLFELFHDGGGMTLAALVLVLLNVGVTWFAYLSWASNAWSITSGAIYRFNGVYASNPESFQGADILGVSVSYRRPQKLWKFLGFGRVSVSFSDDKQAPWEIRGIGNAEAVASLIRGLQRSKEEADKSGPEILRKILEVVTESCNLQQQTLDTINKVVRDMSAGEWPKLLNGLGLATTRSVQASEGLLAHLSTFQDDPLAPPGNTPDSPA